METKTSGLFTLNEAKEIILERLKTEKQVIIFWAGEKRRIIPNYSEQGKLFILAKGKKAKGNYWETYFLRAGIQEDKDRLIAIKEKEIPKRNEEQKWKKAWEKVLNRLVSSGLWPEVQEEIKLAFDIGLDKLKLAYEVYNTPSNGENWKEIQEKRTKAIALIEPKLLRGEGINTSILWTYNILPEVKKMKIKSWKDDNDFELNNIANAIKNKKDYSCYGRTSYDTRFEYKAEANRAWYSEEYKGCGNGYYYIALDSTHALFSEKD
jgi:hypothetical protein